MTLLSPAKLWLLTIVAALTVAYVLLQRQRRRRAVRHPDVRLVAAVSGKAITTGPGRPDMATLKARATYSGMRSARSICATHLTTLPYICR